MTDLKSFQDFKFEYLKRSQISLAVDAYERMLFEIKEFGSPIKATKKTIDFVYDLLHHQYDNNNVCYVATSLQDVFPIAFSLVFENLSIDLDYRIFNGLGLFIEPEYRKKGLGIAMIQYTINDLQKKGVKKFVANFTERESSNKVIEHFGFESMKGTVCKNFF